MATTNLISKSLGNILTECGNGIPNHASPKGSLYVDQDTSTLYINLNDSTAWEGLNTVAYGEVFYQGNTGTTTISSTNVWTEVGNTFETTGDFNGFSADTNSMVVEPGRAGRYQIFGNATIDHVASSDSFEIGISINGDNPVEGAINGASVSGAFTTANIAVNFIADLSDGDTLLLPVRNIDGTNNIIVRHGQIFTIKID